MYITLNVSLNLLNRDKRAPALFFTCSESFQLSPLLERCVLEKVDV